MIGASVSKSFSELSKRDTPGPHKKRKAQKFNVSGLGMKYNMLVGFRMGSTKICGPIHTLNVNTPLAVSRNKRKCSTILLANLHQLVDMLHNH